ncbi:MAG: Crp/Fnr family transcriptional regulator [Alphaproteobacteria bacterium]|nr:Crp/Fnr family transcriptional regulator [Alphaproteobacteria bacterium]MBM3732746.1 Crp/Fnr family transcriptional regulator [Acidimicrobiia bacterium]
MATRDGDIFPRTGGRMGNCFACQERARSEWCALSDADLKLIDDAKIDRDYAPGDVLYHQGDVCKGVYCIKSVLVRLAQPGDTIGYRAFLAGEEHALGAEVLKPSVICFVEQVVARKMIETKPELGLRFLKSISENLNAAEDKFLQSTSFDIRARLAHLLLVLKDRFAAEEKDGALQLELPLSRQDMAAMIGVRPETMSRAIRKFEDDGVAYFSGRTVKVPDISVLFDEIDAVA